MTNAIAVLLMTAGAASAQIVVATQVKGPFESIQPLLKPVGVPAGLPVEAGDVYVPHDDPSRPYRRVDRCPRGQSPALTDWPKPGDKTCRDDSDPPRLYMNAEPWGDVTKTKTLDRCPEGTRPVHVGFPKPGDRTCRAKNEPPAVIVPKNDPAEPYVRVQECPAGQSAVMTHVPLYGDSACRASDDPPSIRVPTGDRFTPWVKVEKCPPAKTRFIVNWPKPGDMGCR